MNFLRQATAAQIVAIGPFVDDTDFATTKTALTIANTDVKLVVNGGASANKNSGGATHRVNGVYGITLDATDTATVGELMISVKVAGALSVWKTFRVIEPVVYDALYMDVALGYQVPIWAAANSAVNLSGTTVKDLSATGVDLILMSDIAAVPGITATLKQAINWLFCVMRNKRTQTATVETLMKDDSATTLATSAKTDDNVTFTRGKYT